MKRTLTFIVLSRDAIDSRELSRALSAHPGASLLMTSDDAEQVFTETIRLRPSGVVINMNNMGEPALKLVQRIVNDCHSTAVICASRDCSPDLILRGMRTGARDFIRLPINDEELVTVIGRSAEFASEHADDDPKKLGRAIAVFSPEGGCGTARGAAGRARARGGPAGRGD